MANERQAKKDDKGMPPKKGPKKPSPKVIKK